MKLKVTVGGVAYDVDVDVVEEPKRLSPIVMGGGVGASAEPATASVSGVAANAVVAPLAGSVSKVLVAEGEKIEAGQVLLVLEAMKMETEITAPAAGTVSAVHVSVGDAVQGGQGLVSID